MIAALAVKSPRDSTLEQTTLNRRQVLLQAKNSVQKLFDHCICMYDAVDFDGPHTEGGKVGPLER